MRKLGMAHADMQAMRQIDRGARTQSRKAGNTRTRTSVTCVRRKKVDQGN
jgi:hypothetical protein